MNVRELLAKLAQSDAEMDTPVVLKATDNAEEYTVVGLNMDSQEVDDDDEGKETISRLLITIE